MISIEELARAKTIWTIRKYRNDEDFKKSRPFEVSRFDGNCLLNEGIAALQNLLIGDAETNYGNANAYIGVGDSTTAEDPAQIGLMAATNKAWKAMEATYPQISAQKTTWRAVFGSADANYAWQEFTVVNATTDTGDNLNRKVSDQGTKAAGQTWTVDLEITWS